MKKWLLGWIGCLSMVLGGCTGTPDNVSAVKDFEVKRYLGKWYEIARYDHSFEEGLSQVTANYSMRDDGGIKVINRGYNDETEQWDEAEGKAYFVDSTDKGHLKVSFFGPFYASYVIIKLDKENYQYALVTGPDREYLWLLARTPTLEQATVDELLNFARQKGYNTDKLIWVEHENS
jgi:apolipoprotein D and lipocalin family protein